MTLLDRLPWADAPWWQAVLDRTAPSPDPIGAGAPAAAWTFWAPLAVGLVLVAVPPTWRMVRILVTLAHELGHAGVGILAGRRFTGFVVRSDMSGHAVTVGRARGPGLVLTTWAGYPAPALLALGLVATALAGWGPLVLGLAALVSVLCLPFVRSWSTAGATLVVAGLAGAMWWWRDDGRTGAALLAVATVLLLGAWRHVVAVAGVPRQSDPADLARLTRWPGWFWVGTHLMVIAASTFAVGWLLWRSAPT